jgi:hypothetical protein
VVVCWCRRRLACRSPSTALQTTSTPCALDVPTQLSWTGSRWACGCLVRVTAKARVFTRSGCSCHCPSNWVYSSFNMFIMCVW